MARLPTFDQRRLLAVSLEETLLSGEKASRKRLEQLINEQRDTILLLYFSKETLSKQLKQIVNHQLLRPDYIVSSLGTEIYRLPEENPLSEWEHYIQQAYAREA
ncbi:MAG: hypothetical protein GWN62_05565, partial [Aliifodinibius sp.]|nr:hypothetical protein [Fodinibius sp.]